MIALLHATALLFYVAAAALLGAVFVRRRAGSRAAVTSIAAITAGAVAHASALILFAQRYGELPLVGLAPSLSTLGLITIVFLLISTMLSDSRAVSLIIVPIVACFVLGALIIGIAPGGKAMAFRGPWFALHVLFAVAAYAGLTVSAAAGLLYLLQFRELKGKRLGRVFRFFPPLPTLDTVGKAGLVVGFPSLTVALLVGWGWSLRFRQALSLEEAQVIWGVITWVVFAIMIGVRAPGLSGRERRGALVSVIGFVFVVLTYVVLRVSPAARAGFL
jgi:ABC-type transport system involved in cytochrome c biogenesis permease subunit